MKVVKVLLNKFWGAFVETRLIDDDYEECIVIPMKRNGIRYSKGRGNNIVVSFSINKKKRTDIYNNSNYVSLYTNKSVMNNAKRYGRDTDLKFIGSVYETKDPHNIFAKVINMDSDELKEIKALDTMYKKLGENEQDKEE